MTTVFDGSPKFGGISGDHARVTEIGDRPSSPLAPVSDNSRSGANPMTQSHHGGPAFTQRRRST